MESSLFFSGIPAIFVTVLLASVFELVALQLLCNVLLYFIQIWPTTYIKRPKPDGFGLFMELLARFELATSSLPRMRSTG